MAKMDLVPREEFDAVKAMVVTLSETVEKQAELIKKMEVKQSPKAAKPRATSKTAKK